MEEDHVAGRVAGAVIDLEFGLAEADALAVVEPAIGRERARVGHAPARAAPGDVVDPELVVGVRPFDGYAGRRLQRRRTAGVVEMAVRDPDLLERQVLI